ncbi:MAG: HAMP domain-containing sensor histidine kinase [Bdellovibrionota bacterium]
MATYLDKILNPYRRIGLRAKLTGLFVFIFGVTTLIFNLAVFNFMIKALEDDFDIALYNYAVDVSKSINLSTLSSGNGDSLPKLDIDQGKILPFPLGNALIVVRNSEGRILSQVGELNDFFLPYKNDFRNLLLRGEEASYRTVNYSTDEADSYRMITFALDTSKEIFLQVAAPLTLLESQINKRLDLLKFGVPMVMIIATFGGAYIAGRALSPLKNMIATAQEINANNLSGRVPIPIAKDEIQKLGLTLNDMLNRIDKAFQSQERFVADASHQLQTPLAILKGELEMIEKKTSDEENQKLIKSSLQEVENLSGIVHDMLLLARIDAGLGALQMQNLFLDEVLLEAISRVERLAQKKSIKISFNISDEQERPTTRGDSDLLIQLFINLIENAIKYSPPSSQVSLNLLWKKGISLVIIKDEGPGIPDSYQDHLYERFSRASQTQKTSGFGLGLSIAHKISQLHSAKLYAHKGSNMGSEFHFEIKNI